MWRQSKRACTGMRTEAGTQMDTRRDEPGQRGCSYSGGVDWLSRAWTGWRGGGATGLGEVNGGSSAMWARNNGARDWVLATVKALRHPVLPATMPHLLPCSFNLPGPGSPIPHLHGLWPLDPIPAAASESSHIPWTSSAWCEGDLLQILIKT